MHSPQFLKYILVALTPSPHAFKQVTPSLWDLVDLHNLALSSNCHRMVKKVLSAHIPAKVIPVLLHTLGDATLLHCLWDMVLNWPPVHDIQKCAEGESAHTEKAAISDTPQICKLLLENRNSLLSLEKPWLPVTLTDVGSDEQQLLPLEAGGFASPKFEY